MKKKSSGKGRRPASKTGARSRSTTRGPRKMKAYDSFDLYLADQPAKNQKIIRALRSFVKRTIPKLEESVKWGNGCWLKGNAPVAYVYSDTGYVQFGFIRGSSLADPKGLLDWLDQTALLEDKIGVQDTALIRVTDDPEEVVELVCAAADLQGWERESRLQTDDSH